MQTREKLTLPPLTISTRTMNSSSGKGSSSKISDRNRSFCSESVRPARRSNFQRQSAVHSKNSSELSAQKSTERRGLAKTGSSRVFAASKSRERTKLRDKRVPEKTAEDQEEDDDEDEDDEEVRRRILDWLIGAEGAEPPAEQVVKELKPRQSDAVISIVYDGD